MTNSNSHIDNMDETQTIDLLIKTNHVRTKLPHQRSRYFAELVLQSLYEAKGLENESIKSSENDEWHLDQPGDDVFNDCMAQALDENYEIALGLANKATEKYPANPESWYVSGFAKSVFGEIDAAVLDYKKAIQLKSSESVYYFELGALYEMKGELKKAIEMYGKAMKLSPGSTVYQYAAGNILFHAQNYKDAITAFQTCVKHDPEIELYQENLAAACNDYAVSGWAQDPNGDKRCVSEESARKAVDLLTRAERLDHHNMELKRLIAENLSISHWVLEKHWGRSFFQTIKGALFASIAAIVIGVFIESSMGTGFSLFVMLSVMAVWIALGFKPGWKINKAVLNQMKIESSVRQQMEA